jgi:nitrogen-specific signal transduction histidine kinase
MIADIRQESAGEKPVPSRRASAAELASSRRKVVLDQALTTLIEAVPDYALVLNEEQQILAVNSRLLHSFGIDEIEILIGRRPGEAIGCIFADEGEDGCGTGRHCAFCGAAASIRESRRFNVQSSRECRLSVNGRKGGPLDLQVVATPVVLDDLHLTVCVFKDISNEKWRNVLERVFFHDVINTAGGIRGIADLLARGRLGDPDQENHYKQWLVDLSDQLIDEISHQRKLMAAEQGKFVPDFGLIEVSDLLAEVHALYVHHEVAAGIELALGPVPAGMIVSDVAILRRILGNLVKNALEATPVGGRVTISASTTDKAITFSVHNPGVMSLEVQLQLFQRSFSTKEASGRGIGTYSAKLFAERYLKGRVAFVSREPEGTTFNLTIPRGIEKV